MSVLAELDVGQILGPVPDWLELGPVEEHDGTKVRKVLGDWSHLPPCDQPPPYLVEGAFLTNVRTPFDRSEAREPVKQFLPGRHVSELKGIHFGKVAIFFNGPSLADHDLFRITCPTIGMNRTHQGYPTWHGPQPDYLCIVDWAWFDEPERWRSVQRHPRIINGSAHSCERCPTGKQEGYTDLDPGWRITRFSRMAPFSFDLERDGYVAPIPATTGHLALQIAVWMGFTELYCLGLDMGGPHFDGTRTSIWLRDANRYHMRQAPLLAERGIKVYVCGSDKSRCTAFPHAPFEAICA